MRRLLPIAFLCAGCSSSEDASPGGGKVSDEVSGLSVSEISLNQAVKVPIMAGGQLVPGGAPVVAGRPGLVRVSVQPEPSFEPREVVARLELFTPGGMLQPLEAKQMVTGGTVEGDLGTSFNFDLPGESLTPELAYAVSLHEASGKARGPASPGAVFPGGGNFASFGAQGGAGPLRMVLVPIQYDADGSGRLPELGAEQVALYRESLLRMYPTANVEIRVHDPVPYSGTIAPNGDGWGDVLQFLLFRRNQDKVANEVAPDEYYYGLFMPKVSFGSYCSGSSVCVLGLSTAIQDPKVEFGRGSVGIGFIGNQAADTMVHETGHAHGRLHAPCAPFGQIQNTDKGYPYPEGRIGVWGLDLGPKTLFDPDGDARDFMGYCDPAWVSDYTWKALFDRITFVSASAGLGSGSGGGGGEPMWMVSVDAEGRANLGREVVIAGEPGGELRMVDVLDENGAVTRRDPARFHAYSDLPGGFLLVPAPQPGDGSFRVGQSTVRWGAPGKALPSR